MECPECGTLMDLVDTTICHIKNSKVFKFGERTGDIYECDRCQQYYFFNLKTEKLQRWVYM